MTRGEEEVPQAALARLDLEFLDHRRDGVLPPGGAQLPPLLGVDRLGGVDVGVHEVLEAAEVVLGPLAQTEVHSARVTDESVTWEGAHMVAFDDASRPRPA